MSTVIAGPITLSSTAPAIVVPAAGPFDTILGLPVHPLVVHAAVVLLPLSAVGVVVLFLVPRWRRGYAWLTLVGLAAGAAAAVAAKESGSSWPGGSASRRTTRGGATSCPGWRSPCCSSAGAGSCWPGGLPVRRSELTHRARAAPNGT